MAHDGLFRGQVKIRTHGICEPCTGSRSRHSGGDDLQNLSQIILRTCRIEIVGAGCNILQNSLCHRCCQQNIIRNGEADGVQLHAKALEAGNVILAVQCKTGIAAEVITNIAIISIRPCRIILMGILIDDRIQLVRITLHSLCPPVLTLCVIEVIVGA